MSGSLIKLFIIVGENVKHYRNLIGISQEALAEKAGITYQYLGKIERGIAKPTIEVLNAIAEAMNIGVFELFNSKEKKETNSADQKLISRFNYLSKGQQEMLFEYIEILKDFEVKKV